ncbi:MAG: glycosyltransferase [Chitinispirillaceae bacterium]
MKSFNKPDIVIIGLTITSSWGNGHATTYRGLVRELSGRGYNVLFLERDMPWYAVNRDMPDPPYGRTKLYSSLGELKERYTFTIQNARMVIVGSFVPDGTAVGEWVTRTARGITAFYDIDTPVTMGKLKRKECEYLTPFLIPRYDLYLSFAGGPILDLLEQAYGSPMARPLYCSVDTTLYYPEETDVDYDLGYMGTFCVDRQEPLELLMLDTARRWSEGRFVVAGPQYPKEIQWPRNVERIEHLAPSLHRKFYCSQRFTLNLTRAEMVNAGYAPSVRLFEAAACGVPIISDYWDGLGSFFVFGEEILLSSSSQDTYRYLTAIPGQKRREIGERARRRVLSQHSAEHRAKELESYLSEAARRKSRKGTKVFTYRHV